jgi:hypothetical protein
LSYMISISGVLQKFMLRLLKCLSPLQGIWWIFEENVQVCHWHYPASTLWALDILILFFCPLMTCIWKCNIQKFKLESIVLYMTAYHISSLHNRPNCISHMAYLTWRNTTVASPRMQTLYSQCDVMNYLLYN